MLRLQLCAIYSQLHKHKAALEQAELSAQTAHAVLLDKHALLCFISDKEAQGLDFGPFLLGTEASFHN